MGDGLLAYFGYPATHEDEAENAVRAGLDLVAKVGRLLLPSGEALQVRVGVATGLVVVREATWSLDRRMRSPPRANLRIWRLAFRNWQPQTPSCGFGCHPQICSAEVSFASDRRAPDAERIYGADQHLQNHRRDRS